MGVEGAGRWYQARVFLITEKGYSLWLINKLVDTLICTSASYELS